MARTHRHKEEPVCLLQDTPDALRELGVDDEQEARAAVREPAQALEGASFLQAVGGFTVSIRSVADTPAVPKCCGHCSI